MLKNIFIPLCSLFLYSFTYATYPIPHYEIIVVETTPPSVQLDMTISQIVDAKEESRFQESKNRIYEVIAKHVSPLLSNADFVDGYNLVQLAAQLPAEKILAEILGEEQGRVASTNPSSFMILVMPKRPRSTNNDSRLSYSKYYSDNKAAVIDNRPVGFSEDGYLGPLNARLQKTLRFLYNRNFNELHMKDPYFVGAVIQMQLNGNQSFFKAQLAGSLPSDMEFPFSQDEPQAEFTAFRLPRSPEGSRSKNQMQGGVVELKYTPGAPTPSVLNIKFGLLGKISETGWTLHNELDDLESEPTEWNGEFGVRSFVNRFNVPHLFGEIKEASGFGPLDSSLAFLYNIQINIHEVELDLQQLKITGMRATVELPVKEYNWLTSILEPGLRWPTAEVPSITQKVIDGGNQKIEPYREQLQTYLDVGGDLLANPDKQTQFFTLIMTILENQSGVQP